VPQAFRTAVQSATNTIRGRRWSDISSLKSINPKSTVRNLESAIYNQHLKSAI